MLLSRTFSEWLVSFVQEILAEKALDNTAAVLKRMSVICEISNTT